MICCIIVTYNPDSELLFKQYCSIKDQVDDIIYIDNCSSNIDYIYKIGGNQSSIVRNLTNKGLAKAQNQGIEIARDKGADFVMLLDQDSVPPANFVYSLLSCFHDYQNKYKIGIIGPAIRNLIKESKENNQGVLIERLFLRNIDINALTSVSFCIASGSFIPMQVLNQVGCMEEKLFIDSIDIEWCLRAQYYGYKVFQTNRTYLDHCLGDGREKRVESHSPLREYYIMRNSTWMIRQKHIPLGYRIRKVFSAIGRICLSIKSLNVEYVKSDLRGFKDGLRL